MGKRRAKVKGKRVSTSVPENYVERGGASGRALDYWLRAVVELKRFPPQHLTERRSLQRRRARKDQDPLKGLIDPRRIELNLRQENCE